MLKESSFSSLNLSVLVFFIFAMVASILSTGIYSGSAPLSPNKIA